MESGHHQDNLRNTNRFSAHSAQTTLAIDHPLDTRPDDQYDEGDVQDMSGARAISVEETRPLQQNRLDHSSSQSNSRYLTNEDGESLMDRSFGKRSLNGESTSRSWSDRQSKRKGAVQQKHNSIEHHRTQSPSRPPFFARNASRMRLASEVSMGTGLEGRPGSLYAADNDAGVPTWRATAVGATPLERTMDAIGMGRYQYAVLILSGLGWAADNMWLQGVALTLPRIQDEWGVRDQWIGLVSSSTFAGMMIGALAWGMYADTFGRKNAFNLTLLITAVFGILSAFSPSFPLLCLCLFLLGTGVGGSMPTDGTIFLEALPKRNHYLLTALSVFFAAGSVATSLLAYFIVPQYSCGGATPCNANDNKGWRYLLMSLGGLTFLFVVARLLFFTLFESPKYLVAAGKHDEARDVLQRIAAFNGQPKTVRLSDVSDIHVGQNRQQRGKYDLETASRQMQPERNDSMDWGARAGQDERQNLLGQEGDAEEQQETNAQPRRHSFGGHEHRHDAEWGAAMQDKPWPRNFEWVPFSWRPSLQETASRYAELLSPYWRKTTILVWAIWTVFTLAYTMVNVFLPKYLENRSGTTHSVDDVSDPAKRQEAMQSVMRDVLFYTLASLPGSLLGAYLIETPLGRIRSMALSTLLLGLSLLAFAISYAPFFVILSSCSISMFASVAYAVIYSYSPEVFKTSLRGTASGTASALSRLAGILAPVLAGILMQLTPNMPLYVGFGLFAVTVWLQLSLPYETRGRDSETPPEEQEDV